MIKQNMKR